MKNQRNGLFASLWIINIILDTGTDCGFCPSLPSGERWGEGIQKCAIHDRLQYLSFVHSGGHRCFAYATKSIMACHRKRETNHTTTGTLEHP